MIAWRFLFYLNTAVGQSRTSVIGSVITILSVGICDNNISLAEKIYMQVEQLGASVQVKTQISVYYSGESLCKDLSAMKRYHILFLDLHFGDGVLNGIEIADAIHKHNMEPLIIFISAYKTYFEEICKSQPFYFLSKPINWLEFSEVVIKAINRMSRNPETFSFNYFGEIIIVPISDIYSFRCENKQVKITLQNEIHLFYDSLDEVLKKLTNYKFIRISQSSVINYTKISRLSGSLIFLNNGSVLKISRRYLSSVKKAYMEHWNESLQC